MADDFISHYGIKRVPYEHDKTRWAFCFTTKTFLRDVTVPTTALLWKNHGGFRQNVFWRRTFPVPFVSHNTKGNKSNRTNCNNNRKYRDDAISARCKAGYIHVVYDCCVYNVAPLCLHESCDPHWLGKTRRKTLR